MNLREAWINLLHKAATGTKRTRTLLTPVGVALFGAFTTMFAMTAILVDRRLDLPSLLPGGARLPVSIPVMALGAAFTAWSGCHFLRARGTPVPFNPPPNLVDTGPYRYARNPMVTGVFLILVGLGFFFGSFSLVFFFTPLYVVLNAWELKKVEEPELERRFGASYTDYRQKVPMFIPRLRRRRSPRAGQRAPESEGDR